MAEYVIFYITSKPLFSIGNMSERIQLLHILIKRTQKNDARWSVVNDAGVGGSANGWLAIWFG